MFVYIYIQWRAQCGLAVSILPLRNKYNAGATTSFIEP